MFSSTYGNSTGYEPKPVAQLAFSPPFKRQQISDTQLKILPVFDYAGKQTVFADRLKKLITTWRLDFLVKNEPAKTGTSQTTAHGVQALMTPMNRFFSPREQRGRVGPGVKSEDLFPDPSGMANTSYSNMRPVEMFSSQQYPPQSEYHNPPQGVYPNPPQSEYHNPPQSEYHNPPRSEYGDQSQSGYQDPPLREYQPSSQRGYQQSDMSYQQHVQTNYAYLGGVVTTTVVWECSDANWSSRIQ